MALASPRHDRWRSEAEPAAESTALFPNTKLVMQLAVDTRPGSMILNGSSQQCPRSWTMTQQWRGVDRLDECCRHHSRISSGALRGQQPARTRQPGSKQVKPRRPRNHRRMTLAVPGQALTCATTRGDV